MLIKYNTGENNALIKNIYQFKEYGSRKILTEFSTINCKRVGLDVLLKKIWETGSTDQTMHESGKLKHGEDVRGVLKEILELHKRGGLGT